MSVDPAETSPAAMVVLHATEIGIGGINAVVLGVGAGQSARFGRGSVHVLVPREHAFDYDGTEIVPHVFPRAARGPRACLAFAERFVRLVLAHRPPFVFLHSTFAGLIGRLMLLCLRPIHRPVVVYCAHGWSFTMMTSRARKRVYAGIERALARLSSAIVNISDAEHRAALEAGLPPARLHCIPNGTRRALAAPGPSPYPARPGRLDLLFVGRLDRQKGIDVLLTILAGAPDLPVHLTVVGSAAVDGVDLPPAPNVTFIAWLRREDLAPYYAHADAVVIPSRWEGHGMVAAEALSFGTPVVASRVGGLASLVEDGVSGFLFDLDEPGGLLAVLSGLDRERLRAMRPAALRRWEAVADRDAMNRRYLELMWSLRADADAGMGRAAPGAAAATLERAGERTFEGRVRPDEAA